MTKSDSIKELATALAKAQGEIKGAKKDGTNPHFRSAYATLEAVLEASQESLAKYGLAILQAPGKDETGYFLETIVTHSSGEWMAFKSGGNLSKDDPQGLGSFITYLRRYVAMGVLKMAPIDDDGEGAMIRHEEDREKKAIEVAKNQKELPPVNGQTWKEVVLHIGTIKGTPLGKLTRKQLLDVESFMKTKTGMNPEDKRLKEALVFALDDPIPMGDEELKKAPEQPF